MHKEMNLKRQLRIYMKARGITMAWLSKESGVALSTLHGWTNGVAPNDLKKLKQIADLLGTNIDWLCFGSGVQVDSGPSIKEFEKELNIGIYEVVLRKVKG